MGLMLENVSERLCGPGGPHEFAPSKHPRARLRTMELAGQLQVAFTTGLLIGIGETPEEIVDSFVVIRDLHERYGHIQEVIIQNFRAKPGTPMADAAEPTVNAMRRVVAVARLMLGPEANIQVPPNLTWRDYPIYLLAGINDWGGISPLTIDYVNPEAPWPQITELRRETERLGFTLVPRLPIYPEYVRARPQFVPEPLRPRIDALSDAEGYVRGGVERYAA
jgi:FO synthase